MSQPLRRLAAAVASVALAVSLSACTAGHWVPEAPPAAGVQVDQGGIKLRNVVLISDPAGSAMLVGAVASRDAAATVVGLAYAPEAANGSFGELTPLTIQPIEIAQGDTVAFDGATMQVSDPKLLLGRLAELQFSFADGQQLRFKVPIMSSEHPDFADAYKAAHG